MGKSKVYFTKEITPESLVRIYKALGFKLKGKVAVKLHSGEEGNQNYVKPEFVKQIIDYVDGTVVECNTAYEGARNETEKHKDLMEKHGWSKYFAVDIMDAEGPDLILDIPNGKVIKENYVGKNLKNYNFTCDKKIDQTADDRKMVCAQFDIIVRKKRNIKLSAKGRIKNDWHCFRDYIIFFMPMRFFCCLPKNVQAMIKSFVRKMQG